MDKIAKVYYVYFHLYGIDREHSLKMCYETKLAALMEVDFDSDRPWLTWKHKDVVAILGMFGYGEREVDEVDDGVRDRQSNTEGGRLLFVLSQSSKNPYRGCRVAAQNGSYVPLIPLSLLTENFCAGLDDLITRIKLCLPGSPAALPAPPLGVTPLDQLWRQEPHGNWKGSLPERIVSDGERLWYKTNRAAHAYSMNEWQVSVNGAAVYAFDGRLATDPGAIRIVSVTGRRTLTGAGFNWAGVGAPTEGFKGVVQGKALAGKKYYAGGEEYTHAATHGMKPVRDDKPLGVPTGFNKKKAAKRDYTEPLHDRAPIRFYFSFNHYRTIEFNVKGERVLINPWFAIIE